MGGWVGALVGSKVCGKVKWPQNNKLNLHYT